MRQPHRDWTAGIQGRIPARIASLEIAIMPLCAPSSPVITRAVDLLTAAGLRVHHMQGPKRIDRDEYEVTIAELIGRREAREGDVVTITGRHEDHGRTILRREAGVFTIEAEDLSLIRDAFAPMEMAD